MSIPKQLKSHWNQNIFSNHLVKMPYVPWLPLLVVSLWNSCELFWSRLLPVTIFFLSPANACASIVTWQTTSFLSNCGHFQLVWIPTLKWMCFSCLSRGVVLCHAIMPALSRFCKSSVPLMRNPDCFSQSQAISVFSPHNSGLLSSIKSMQGTEWFSTDRTSITHHDHRFLSFLP